MSFDFLWESMKLSFGATAVFVMFALWVGAVYRVAFSSSSMTFTPWFLRVMPFLASCVLFAIVSAARYREQITLQMFAVCALIYFQQCTTHLFLLTRNKNRIIDNDETVKLKSRRHYYHFMRDAFCGLLTGAMTASHYLDDGIFPIVVTASLVLGYDAYIEQRYGRVRVTGETRNAILHKLFSSIATICVAFVIAAIASSKLAEEPTLFMLLVGVFMALIVVITRVFTIDEVEADYYVE